MAFYKKPNCIETCLLLLISTSDENRIITNDLQLNCAEFGIQTCLSPIQEGRILALDNRLTVTIKALKHDSLVVLILAYCLSTYILPVLNMGLK